MYIYFQRYDKVAKKTKKISPEKEKVFSHILYICLISVLFSLISSSSYFCPLLPHLISPFSPLILTTISSS